jgi:hypothetical protein
MILKARYKLSYILNREPKELVLDVELKQVEGIPQKGQNIWKGFAILNGKPYNEEDLSCCVNAKTAVERIGHKIKEKIKNEAKEKKQSFRIKKEELI